MNLLSSVFVIFTLATITAAMATLFAIRWFPRIQLLDFPERYGLNRAKIPYPGGVALLPLFLGFLWFDTTLWPIALLTIIIGGISFWDDQKQLPALFRLSTQILVAIALIMLGIRIQTVSDPFHKTNLELPTMLQYVVTIIWSVFLPNALNWFDGLKGLCVGTAGIGFLALGVLSLFWPELFFDPAQIHATKSVFWLSGLCFGSFYYFFKGRILLGDTGSQTLGFLLAVFSIISGAKIATTLIVLAIPLLDTVAVVFRRIFIDKKSPFKGDGKHFHHQLSRRFGEPKSVIILCSTTLVLGALGAFLNGLYKLIALSGVSVLVLAAIIWMYQQDTDNLKD